MRSDHLSKHVMAHSPDCHSKNDDSHDNVTKSDYNSNLDISHSHIPVSRSSSESATLKVPEFKPYHIASKKEKRNVCKFCHKLFNNQSHVKRHEKKHCPNRITDNFEHPKIDNQYNLSAHPQDQPDMQKKMCGLCNETFSKSNLSRHKKIVHGKGNLRLQ